MSKAAEITHYSIDDAFYFVERTKDEIKAFVMDSRGSFRAVSAGYVEANGTPVDTDEFTAVQKMRAGHKSRPRPALRIVKGCKAG